MKLDRPLAGERIVIRSYAPEDLDFCTGMWFDPENGRYLSDPAREYVDEVFQQALDGLAVQKIGQLPAVANLKLVPLPGKAAHGFLPPGAHVGGDAVRRAAE